MGTGEQAGLLHEERRASQHHRLPLFPAAKLPQPPFERGAVDRAFIGVDGRNLEEHRRSPAHERLRRRRQRQVPLVQRVERAGVHDGGAFAQGQERRAGGKGEGAEAVCACGGGAGDEEGAVGVGAGEGVEGVCTGVAAFFFVLGCRDGEGSVGGGGGAAEGEAGEP